MKLSEDFNGADLRNVCTEAGNPKYIIIYLSPSMYSIYLVYVVMLENSLSATFHFLVSFPLSSQECLLSGQRETMWSARIS